MKKPSYPFYIVILLTALLGGYHTAHASLTIEITQGVDGAVPIAIVPFQWEGKDLLPPQSISDIIASNLYRSGRFSPLPERQLPMRPGRVQDINYAQWQRQGIEYIVMGSITERRRGRYTVSFQLLDVLRGETEQRQTHADNPDPLAGEIMAVQYTVREAELRTLAHQISDRVYEALTGERGAFATRIAYVAIVPPKPGSNGGERYRLQVADSDLHDPQVVLDSPFPITSPAWSPDGTHLAYVSFEGHRSGIYVSNLKDSSRELITQYPRINGAPAWSPDGKKLAVVLSKDGSPDIYVVDIKSKKIKKVTKGRAIDTEPSWLPDGRSLLITSNRGGKPQIYQLSLDTGALHRLTFVGNYNARASLSPRGDQIVFVHQTQKGFNIAVQDVTQGSDGVLTGRAVQTLTNAQFDESPSFAPNGSMVVYATWDNNRRVLGAVSVDGKVRLSLPASGAELKEPTWSPFLN